MDVFAWTYEHWIALTMVVGGTVAIVAIVRLVRYCPTIDDDAEL